MKKTIRNCKVKFDFECPKEWSDLQKSENEKIRYCEACSENVFWCEDDQETIEHATQAHCIARGEPHLPSQHQVTIGRPSIETMKEQILFNHYSKRERAIDESLKVENYKLCKKCGYPVSTDLISCRVCSC